MSQITGNWPVVGGGSRAGGAAGWRVEGWRREGGGGEREGQVYWDLASGL